MASKSRIKQKKRARKTKRRLAIFGPLAVLAVIYFLVTSANFALDIISLNNEKKSLEQELVTLKEDEENLKNEIKKLKDPDYIARFARENYLYSKDGEYIIKIDNNKKKSTKKDYSKHYQYLKYATAGCLLVGGIIIIWMIRKK